MTDTQEALQLLHLPPRYNNNHNSKHRQLQQNHHDNNNDDETSALQHNTEHDHNFEAGICNNSNDQESNNNDNNDDDDQVFVDALHLCSKARRHDVASAIYPELCSTEACRQMAIYACGKCGVEHESHVMRLLSLATTTTLPPNQPSSSSSTTTTTSSSSSVASIACYNTALTVLRWQRAYHLFLNDMINLPPFRPNDKSHHEYRTSTILDVLSCNIVLNSLAKAHRGEEALQLWKSMTCATTMTASTKTTTSLPIFPTPDRTSWHHVMTACLNYSHRQQQKQESRGEASQEQHQRLQQQQARNVYYDLFLPFAVTHDVDHGGHHHRHDKSTSSFARATNINDNDDDKTKKIGFVPNHHTYDLLSRGFARMSDWEMVRMVEEHRKCQEQQLQLHQREQGVVPPKRQRQKQLQSRQVTRPRPSSWQPHNEMEDKSLQPPLTDATPTTTSLSSNKDDLEYQYYYFQHWTGMTKVGRGNTAYWILGTYNNSNNNNNKKHQNRNNIDGSRQDIQEGDECLLSTWRVAIQPNRNPSKNGIKLLFLVEDAAARAQAELSRQEQDSCTATLSLSNVKTNERKAWKKLGYVLMINARDSPQQNGSDGGGPPTSTLLGLFVDPVYRKQGLSKTFLAIWLYCCRKARLQAQSGLIRKPLLALVLEHTFGFVPMLMNKLPSNNNNRDGDAGTALVATPQGVEVEIFWPPPISVEKKNNDSDDISDARNEETSMRSAAADCDTQEDNELPTSSSTPAVSSIIHLYSPSGKSLTGSFSPWDLAREGIVIDTHPPPLGSRGRRVIHLMCNFVSALPDAMMDERIDSILSRTSTTIPQSTNTDSSPSSKSLQLVLASHPELQNVFLGK